jgi:hypothetical protein
MKALDQSTANNEYSSTESRAVRLGQNHPILALILVVPFCIVYSAVAPAIAFQKKSEYVGVERALAGYRAAVKMTSVAISTLRAR